MNRTLIALFATAALAVPGLAQAHTTRAELRHDVRAVHQERHELNRARHHGNPARIKEERREYRGAKHELREDARDFRKTHRR